MDQKATDNSAKIKKFQTERMIFYPDNIIISSMQRIKNK